MDSMKAIWSLLIIIIVGFALVLHFVFNKKEKKQRIRFKEYYGIIYPFLPLKMKEDGLESIHIYDYALLQYIFYLETQELIDKQQSANINQYRFTNRGYFQNKSSQQIENELREIF